VGPNEQIQQKKSRIKDQEEERKNLLRVLEANETFICTRQQTILYVLIQEAGCPVSSYLAACLLSCSKLFGRRDDECVANYKQM
jgi:hypothetical protein